MNINNNKPQKVENCMPLFMWLFSSTFLFCALMMFYDLRFFPAIGFLANAFCSCPLTDGIFEKLRDKTKLKNIKLISFGVSIIFLVLMIQINNAIIPKQTEPTTSEVITTKETTTELTKIIEETTTPEITTVKVTTAPSVTTTKKVTTTLKTNKIYTDVFYKYCDKVNKQTKIEVGKSYNLKEIGNMTIVSDGSKKVIFIFEGDILQQISYHFAGKVMAITMQDDVKKYCIGYASDNEKKCVQKYDDMLQFVFNNADFKAIESTGTITMLSTVEPIVTTLPIVTTITETEPPVIITEKPKPIIRYVYIASSGNGTKYHNNDQCSRMNGDCYQLTMEEAEAQGFELCKKCYG